MYASVILLINYFVNTSPRIRNAKFHLVTWRKPWGSSKDIETRFEILISKNYWEKGRSLCYKKKTPLFNHGLCYLIFGKNIVPFSLRIGNTFPARELKTKSLGLFTTNLSACIAIKIKGRWWRRGRGLRAFQKSNYGYPKFIRVYGLLITVFFFFNFLSPLPRPDKR